MNWILYGFKGVGKSFFAKRGPLPYLDTDRVIEQRVGMSIVDLVAREGTEGLIAHERSILKHLDVTGHLIAVGGATPLDPVNLAQLRRLGKLVYLATSKALIKQRQLSPPLPSFLDSQDPEGSFERMWSTRIGVYERIMDLRIDIEGKTETEVVQALWQAIS